MGDSLRQNHLTEGNNSIKLYQKALLRFGRIRIEQPPPIVCVEEVSTDAIDPLGIRGIIMGRLMIASLLIYLKRVLPASLES